MPAPDAILGSLATIANGGKWVATAWHLVLGAAVLALVFGWRPSNRRAGQLLSAPFISVSIAAWLAGNPFNAAIFAMLSTVAWLVATRLSRDPVRLAPFQVAVPGAMLVAFGWSYPHFLATDSWVPYLYAAPCGLLPCPTLAVTIGGTLVLGNLGSDRWRFVLVPAGLLYGAIGVFTLGVTLDYGLIAGASLLAVVSHDGAWRFLPGGAPGVRSNTQTHATPKVHGRRHVT